MKGKGREVKTEKRGNKQNRIKEEEEIEEDKLTVNRMQEEEERRKEEGNKGK